MDPSTGANVPRQSATKLPRPRRAGIIAVQLGSAVSDIVILICRGQAAGVLGGLVHCLDGRVELFDATRPRGHDCLFLVLVALNAL